MKEKKRYENESLFYNAPIAVVAVGEEAWATAQGSSMNNIYISARLSLSPFLLHRILSSEGSSVSSNYY